MVANAMWPNGSLKRREIFTRLCSMQFVRKTANVVLGQAFGIASGVVVDTHVHRLARRMGFSSENTPEKIEQDLMEVFPKRTWIEISNLLILHGRRTCPARKPKCDMCRVAENCPQIL